ncbi:MAG: hypothetical protein D3913_15705 [Candidatus Electrothrix sp. LOE1_4_5]|nr:hypothetical protein [Candidatus Electrothrix gigas]
MQNFILATFVTLFVLSATSSFAVQNTCHKVSGDTPDEAFRAAVEVLNQTDAEMGPSWIRDNMQIRLLPNKVNGKFVALVYSTTNDTTGCDVDQPDKVADKTRPQCDQTQCTI